MCFSQFWRPEVQVQQGQMTVLFLVADCLLYPHMAEGVFSGLFYKDTNPTHVGVFLRDLITVQSPHLLTHHIGHHGFNIQMFTATAKSLQSCPTQCDPIDGSPPGSPVPGILQARTPEWVAISFSIAWKWKVKVKLLSRARLLATPWTAACQDHPSMGSSRQEYWSGVPLPSPYKCLGGHKHSM